MVEQAKYEVLRNINAVEIRRYPQLIIARVDGLGDGGFNLLFSFITGDNRQKANVKMTAPVVSEQIAMTAPVVSEEGSIAFIMPDGYTLETTPEPLDNRIEIIAVPERTVAALRFSGRWSASIFRKKTTQLLDELRKAGVEATGQVFSMRYNGPFTPWFLRRNEVAAPVSLQK
ncbi:TPA: heme-binding protein [Candidatus Bathyarchaeota archaeon]|nr:heme-binding protein [Candidatus Bathyarchaeota archaeon]HIJ08278.1 heme-binding protein [Candidatus Bathyarchaeota archaeon]